MGEYVERLWAPEDAGGLSRKDRAAGRYLAYVPDELGDRLPTLGAAAQGAAEDALAVLARADERIGERGRYLNHLLIRSESISSSWIEGNRISPKRLAIAELLHEGPQQALDVVANVRATEAAIAGLADRGGGGRGRSRRRTSWTSSTSSSRALRGGYAGSRTGSAVPAGRRCAPRLCPRRGARWGGWGPRGGGGGAGGVGPRRRGGGSGWSPPSLASPPTPPATRWCGRRSSTRSSRRSTRSSTGTAAPGAPSSTPRCAGRPPSAPPSSRPPPCPPGTPILTSPGSPTTGPTRPGWTSGWPASRRPPSARLATPPPSPPTPRRRGRPAPVGRVGGRLRAGRRARGWQRRPARGGHRGVGRTGARRAGGATPRP